MRMLAAIVAVLVTSVASPALAAPVSASFGVSLQVVRRAPTGIAGSALPALVAAPGQAAVPCGTAGSGACAAAATSAQASLPAGAPVVVTVLTDGAPTAIIER